MRTGPSRDDASGMAYAVVWSENGGLPSTGRIELASRFLRLAGGRHRELHYHDVADVRIDRRPSLRLAGRPTLVIETRAGEIFRLASFDGVGSLHELAESLETARHRVELR